MPQFKPFEHRARAGVRSAAAPARGAATLVVVMVLFFLVAMVAAYSNRTMIFDQRTASNQLRSTQAFEAAEAGVEWTLAQLNAGLADNSCKPSTTAGDAAHAAFRDRFLFVQDTDLGTGLMHGEIRQVRRAPANSSGLRVRCAFDGAEVDDAANASKFGWSCSCEQFNTSVAAPDRPSGGKPAPAFNVTFARAPAVGVDQGGTLPRTVIRLVAWGCSQTTNCFDSTPSADAGTAISGIYAHITLRPALRTPPSSPLTVRGNVNPLPAGGLGGGASVQLTNDPQVALRDGRQAISAGLTVTAGGTVATANLESISAPGTPGLRAVAELDTTLSPAAIAAADFPPAGLSSADRFFVLHFGLTPAQYQNQPAIVVLDCETAVCTAAQVKQAIERNPGAPIWLRGTKGLLLDADIGENNSSTAFPSAAAATQLQKSAALGPVVLIVEGDVDARDGADFWGVIYGRKPSWTWTVDGAVTVRGAILAEGDFSVVAGAALPQLRVDYSDAHAKGVFNFLRTRAGSFVRTPTGWRDWYTE
jgi:hypothetical protein